MKRQVLSITWVLILVIGMCSHAAAYSTPPTWMPMEMMDVTYDADTNRLAVSAPSGPASLDYKATGTYDPAAVWGVLNGTAVSRRLGWNDPGYTYTDPNTSILAKVRSVYGTGASLWIETTSRSEGLAAYLAVGTYGVNSDDSLSVDTSNPGGVPYSPIFGTAGSSPKWRWDGLMDHNSYAVPAASLTESNQIFSATYRIYVGDSAGNELLVDKSGNAISSAAVTTTWQWRGPALPLPAGFSFTPVTAGATAFATASNAVTVTGVSGAVPISISGGNTPQYTVSTDGGTTWSAWSATTPATVSPDDLVKVRQTSSPLPFTTTTTTLNVGSFSAGFSVTTGYLNPPSWMPMAMLSVAFDGTALSVVDEATKLGEGVYAEMSYIPPGSYAPGKPWSFLNGAALSRRLGWDDPTAAHGNGIHITGEVLNLVRAQYGEQAGIWIERVSQSPGLETYFADGMWGVGGTGNALSGTPLVYTDSAGFPVIYVDNYYGIFGTGGSPTKWQWDGTMIHNVYAVPAAYLTEPNQLFTATYRVYIGDSQGNDLAPAAATTEVWTWKGPATLPDNVPDALGLTGRTGMSPGTVVESDPITVTGVEVPTLISVSGGEYTVSTDNGVTWSDWSASSPSTVTSGCLVKVRQTCSAGQGMTTAVTLTIGGVAGSFSVTTADATPDGFAFESLSGVDPATAYESNPVTVSGVDTSIAVSVSTGASWAVSTDNGATWSDWNYTEGSAEAGNLVKVRITSSPDPDTTVTATLTLGSGSGSFSITTNEYTAPPLWTPMTMLDISLQNGRLAIEEQAEPVALSPVVLDGTFDPARPWGVVNSACYSRQLGWNPAAGMNAAAIQSAFGEDASVWIEELSSSGGMQTYLAIGKYGVNVNNTTEIDEAAPPYAPIFGTDGSSKRWRWDYQMDHNTYAVPATFLKKPNQKFSARYRIYIGDSQGRDIAPAAATTTMWTWQGPEAIPAIVPKVVGKYEAKAGRAITARELAVGDVTLAYSDTVRVGKVISQSPAAGAAVEEGASIDLVISQGPEPVEVPAVAGTTLEESRSALIAARLRVGSVSRAYSSGIPAGSVISQVPAAGESVAPGTRVKLVVSRGEAPVKVPKVVRTTLTEAEAALTAAGLTLGTVTEISSSLPPGTVIRQKPSAGASVAPGTAVNLVISAGAQGTGALGG